MPDSQPPLPHAEAAANAPIGRNRQFRLLFVCLLVIGAGNSMLLAVAPPLVRQLNLADSSVGWIFSLSALLWVFASPYWGRLSDRIGRKPVAALGLAAYAVSMASFGAVVLLGLNNVLVGMGLFVALMLARSIFGAFGSASSPAAQAYIADRTTVFERTEQLAGLTSAFALGQAFGPAICAALAAWVGLVFPIWLIALLAAGAAFSIWRYLPENTPPKVERPRGEWRASLALMNDRRLSAYLLYGFALSVVAGVTVQVFGLFTMDRLGVEGSRGAELTAAGFMVNALALLATQLAVLPRLQMGPRSLMAWGAGLLALGVGIQIVAPSLGALLVAQAVQGLGAGLARPGFTGGASVAVKSHEQGAAAGLVVATNGAGFVFSPLIGGVAYERFGMNVPLLIAVGILIGMTVFALMSRRLRNVVVDGPQPTDPTNP
ncbi:MFS transporter [Terricaulis silvestris]|uniref:Metal-tetracycline/H(+) antiporter n=1 Tax=Terricaulis silvestris TaxID=2686094 RepID=A0A6I6MI47_9CAUL|nr:MFS transporter [Terricaulis silvestris]QGZ94149.1 Metal-tetracycline/H(+) antiporter [Terricaulis silvestris]